MQLKAKRLAKYSLLAGSLLLMFPMTGVSAGEEESPDKVDILVAVDESASLSSAAVRAEVDAVKTIINLSEMSVGGLRVGVLPFSSGKDSPRIVEDCALSEISEDSIATLTKCANQITRQKRRGSSDTDFAATILKAVDLFKSDKNGNSSKVLVLMTDGKYDPNGDQMTSPSEQKSLDEALLYAKKNKVFLWALGFGQADIPTLNKYVADAADPELAAKCPASPVALPGTDENLSEQMRGIILLATCTGGVDGSPNPEFKFAVSPLLSRINFELTNPSGSVSPNTVSVLRPDGSEACSNASVVANRWICTERLDGQSGGTWTARSNDATQKNLRFRATWNGSIDVVVNGCVVEPGEESKPVITLSRADGKPIDFDVDDDVAWPKVSVVATSKNVEFRTIEVDLDAAETQLPELLGAPVGSEIKVSFAPVESSEDALIIKAHKISTCIIIDNPSTTTIPVKNGGGGGGVEPTPTTPTGSGTPIWLWILGAVAIVGASALAFRQFGGKKFPEGSELQVRNHFNKSVFNPIEEIAGKRTVYFDVTATSDTPSVSVFSSKSGARYSLKRISEEEMQVTSLWKAPEPEQNDDQSILDDDPVIEVGEPFVFLVDEAFNPRNSDPIDADGRRDDISLRVTWPIEE